MWRPQLDQLHQMRRSNEDSSNSMITRLIDRGVLEDVPPHYHYLACWALAQGAVELCFSRSWNYRLDSEELMKFITGVGVTIGNRGQYRDPSKLFKFKINSAPNSSSKPSSGNPNCRGLQPAG